MFLLNKDIERLLLVVDAALKLRVSPQSPDGWDYRMWHCTHKMCFLDSIFVVYDQIKLMSVSFFSLIDHVLL